MSLRRRVASTLRNLIRRGDVERDIDEELRAYVEMVADEKRQSGVPECEARRQALIEVQGVEQVKEQVRDARAGAVVQELARDLTYSARILSRNRGFTAAALATLALGIGVSAATFSLVDTVIFRPLPYDQPSRIVKIWSSPAREPIDNVAMPDFLDLQQRSRAFERMAADDGSGVTIAYGNVREAVGSAIVTSGWLAALGVAPAVGRDFLAEEFEPGRDAVAIITHAYWRGRFGADAAIVGRVVSIDGEPRAIVGVLPPNVMRWGADVLLPLVRAEYSPAREDGDLDVLARLRPGVTLEAARAEIDALARQLQIENPSTNAGRTFALVPLDKYYAGIDPRAGRGLLLALGAVGLVLLIACVNVANLMLARSAVRARECVIRTALGAGRSRLIRQLLVENVLLFAAGGLAGTMLAWWIVDGVTALAVAGGYVPERMVVLIDGRVLAFSLLLSLATGLVFGLAPALHATRVDLTGRTMESSYAVSGGARRNRVRRLLIVGELTLSLVLLIGFGLLVRSFAALQTSGAGFASRHLLVTGSDAGGSFADAMFFWRQALERASTVAGVERAALTSRPPMHGARQQAFVVDGMTDRSPADAPRAGDILVSAGYFRTMAIPVVKGRVFADSDDGGAPAVAIVSETFARRYFPNQDPLGRRVQLLERSPQSCCSSAAPVDGVWREIVGVVGDVRQGNLDEQPAATIYRPYTQIVEHDMFLVARAQRTATVPRVAADLGAALRATDGSRVWWDVRAMDDVIGSSESVRLRRFVLVMLGAFASLALVLSAVGLYGVMAYFVVERRREIGIRVALGAQRSTVLRHVLGEAARLVVVGLALGCIAAQLLTRLLSSLLFGVTATDAVTYAFVSGVLAVVALSASYLPARRAALADPLPILRDGV